MAERSRITMDRRTVLQGLGIATLGAAALGGGRALAVTPGPGPLLFEPKVEQAQGGLLSVAVDARMASYTLGGQRVAMRSYDAGPLGRTLRLKAGDTLRLTLNNQLPFDPLAYLCTATPVPGDNAPRGFNVTNMHLHGVHVSPNSPADNILLMVRPGETQHYVYDIPKDHPPGTYFYHAHFHGSVALQVASGMSGALIVEGPMDAIPEIRAAESRVIVFQTQRFDALGVCDDYKTLMKPDSQVYVNGQVRPVVRMRPGEVQRWHLVNSSHFENVTLTLEGHGLTVLCYDGNPLPKTQVLDTLRLIPGNRADLLVKAGAPGLYRLDGGDPAGVVAYVEVAGDTRDMPLYAGALPPVAMLKPIAEMEVGFGRRLEFGMAEGPPSLRYTVNGKPFTCADAWSIPLGAVEEWEVYNHTADSHPFHIHVNPFQMLSGGNVQPGVWLDTVELPPFERIRFRTRFADFTGTFVFHCHNLQHEDLGMMQAIQVVAP
ncbi:MAG: multicopper oxidase domain-containing protein [Phaeospirillum sp.]|nr:multicopper oxidase domain-containing protein [Phaeospirillum sp.]